MNRFLALFLFTAFPIIGRAGELAEARNMLSNWGLAYCINAASTEKPINLEAQRTMGAYFQRGQHNSEDAYVEVRRYFNRELASKKLISKDSGKVMPFVTCMDLIRTREFGRLINNQDKYVTLKKK